jgi:hypothetical protein
MCRLLLANRSGINELVQALASFPNCPHLSDYLKGLELKDGGHGNGLALVKNGQLTLLEKGVALGSDHIASLMESSDYDWALFHTREASLGTVSDANCHPFVVEGNPHLVVAVNGNELQMGPLAALLDITDSEFIARMTVSMKLPFPRALSCFASNFAGFVNGRPFVRKGDRQLQLFQKGEALVFSSDFPYGLENITGLEEHYCWIDGQEIGGGI